MSIGCYRRENSRAAVFGHPAQQGGNKLATTPFRDRFGEAFAADRLSCRGYGLFSVGNQRAKIANPRYSETSSTTGTDEVATNQCRGSASSKSHHLQARIMTFQTPASVPSTSQQSAAEQSNVSPTEAMADHFASIQSFGSDLPDEAPGRVLNWFRQMVTLLGITAFHGTLSFVASLCLLLTIRFVFFTSRPGIEGILLFVAAVIVGGLIAATQLMIVCRYEEYPFHLLLARRLRRVIAGRRNPVVHPNEEGSRFCEIVPQERWNRLRLETATDLVWVRIDGDGVWMEGDRHRYHFGPSSILGAIPQSFTPAGGWTQLHAALIYVRTPDGPEEIPLVYRDFRFANMNSSDRRLQRDAMVDAICEIARGSEYEPIYVPTATNPSQAPDTSASNNPYAPPRMTSHTGA